MRTWIRLDPPIPVETPKGYGLAHAWIDGGIETDLCWLVVLESGEWWEVENPHVRGCKNWTVGRLETTPLEREASAAVELADGVAREIRGSR